MKAGALNQTASNFQIVYSQSMTPPSPGRGGTYLLTWTTWGTWLPGDERGFVSEVPDPIHGSVTHNRVGERYDRDMPTLREQARQRMNHPEIVFHLDHARILAHAFDEVRIGHSLSTLRAAIMRTHCHLVVASREAEGATLLGLFKGVASRRLSQTFGKPGPGTWWTRHGSRRLLTTQDSIIAAVQSVGRQDNPFLLGRPALGSDAGTIWE